MTLYQGFDGIDVQRHAGMLTIPALPNYTVEKDNSDPRIAFSARDASSVVYECLTCDGPLALGETFDRHVRKINNDTIAYLRKIHPKNGHDSIMYLKDIKANFHFKLFLQDAIAKVEQGESFVRSVNAFFMNPRDRYFYQLSISMGPLLLSPDSPIKPGIICDEDDKATRDIITKMEYLVRNTTYRVPSQM